MSELIEIILSDDPAVRDKSLDGVCRPASCEELLGHIESLDEFRRRADNLYHRVRSLFFLATIYRYYLPARLAPRHVGQIPFAGYQHLLARRFSEAIDALLREQHSQGPSDGLSSALAQAYRQLGFQTLADQVRRSVRTVRGNQWMFRVGHPQDQPLRVRPELRSRADEQGMFPVLHEQTAVRMDFSHSAWSDIFFLGMDFPAGARVLNVSIDLGVHGRDQHPRPPIESYLRVIDAPVLRLVSVDLGAVTELTHIHELFDFARDYLGLLKAGVIAAGIVPPGMEGSEHSFGELFSQMIRPGAGLELVSQVNDIPKGSRLAVSTNLLGSLISICMRATGQVTALTGPLSEQDRRLVAARAILGEWLGGSGGGWQDSGGIWPGIKLISGAAAEPEDPEFKISRGRLLPNHRILDEQDVSGATRQKLQDSLVLVHGGLAQNVGPILEMVTEKYLLRSDAEWQARQQAISLLDEVVRALQRGDIRQIGSLTTRNFTDPIQTIIPWATNLFTDQLIAMAKKEFSDQFWGFWMLGGMAGGGMGFIFDPRRKLEAQEWLQRTMSQTKRDMEHALPFAMEPVVYDFSINDRGSWAELRTNSDARMPVGYYGLLAPKWLRAEARQLSASSRRELEQLGELCRQPDASQGLSHLLLDRLLPQSQKHELQHDNLGKLLEENGFDRELHEQIRTDLRSGRIGLAQNRLPSIARIEDVLPEDIVDVRGDDLSRHFSDIGEAALRAGTVAVVTLAAGVGSRWTEGAGVVKAINPFCKLAGRHRSFLEIHLAKSRRTSRQFDCPIPHVFTTGYLTDRPICNHLTDRQYYGYRGKVHVSAGRSVGLRMIPTLRDLRFEWEEMPQQMLDEQQQKVRASLRAALLNWAHQQGEAADYTDNAPMQCLHPVGHWYEFPNLLRNGTLARMLAEQPQLDYLLLHNIDTLGANLDPSLLGLHIDNDWCLSYEVIPRRLEDRGGGLARIDGHVRLIEGLAIPREEDEFRLSFYNSMTTWITINRLLDMFGLTRSDLTSQEKVDAGVRQLSQRVPTYITLKNVKKRWGHGQEDVYPVSQFEKLWGDMSALSDISCGFLVTPVLRGQQLKHPAQLDGWLRDGSAHYVTELCDWDE